jgi:uncharacterized RDD family membrane protein YckC
MKKFLKQTPAGKYKLNRLGLKAIRLIKDFETLSIETEFTKNPSAFPVAKKSRRLEAFLVDMAVAFTITIVTTMFANISVLLAGDFFDLNIFLFLAFLWMYSTLLEGFTGQTLGKTVLGLKVVTVTGKKLSYDEAAVRNLGKCFLLPIDLLAGYKIKDEKYIKYFDKVTGTTVISTRL